VKCVRGFVFFFSGDRRLRGYSGGLGYFKNMKNHQDDVHLLTSAPWFAVQSQ